MDRTRIERLTEQQRICLRHVYLHRTSKEIAPLLGIAPGSVDQHIKAAIRLLDVPDRRTAARILAEHESADPPQPLVYQPPELVRRPDPPETRAPIESGLHQGRRSGEALREKQASFKLLSPAGAPTLPLPIGGARPGNLNWLSRLVWILVIAIGVALAFGALVAGVEALVRLVRP